MLTPLVAHVGRLAATVSAGAVTPLAVLVPVIGYVLLKRDIEVRFSLRKVHAP